MAVKTITIDMEAYEILSAEKKGKESFSKLIKRRIRPECTGRTLLAVLPSHLLSEDTLDRTEELVRSRKASLAESPLVETGD
jgi:predicted CopG family antitoxin